MAGNLGPLGPSLQLSSRNSSLNGYLAAVFSMVSRVWFFFLTHFQSFLSEPDDGIMSKHQRLRCAEWLRFLADDIVFFSPPLECFFFFLPPAGPSGTPEEYAWFPISDRRTSLSASANKILYAVGGNSPCEDSPSPHPGALSSWSMDPPPQFEIPRASIFVFSSSCRTPSDPFSLLMVLSLFFLKCTLRFPSLTPKPFFTSSPLSASFFSLLGVQQRTHVFVGGETLLSKSVTCAFKNRSPPPSPLTALRTVEFPSTPRHNPVLQTDLFSFLPARLPSQIRKCRSDLSFSSDPCETPIQIPFSFSFQHLICAPS